MPEEKGPLFFASTEAFRRWLRRHHDREEVVWVGYHKVATGKPSMRWEESVRAALCYGWIDGLTKSIDEERYMRRFTPRRPGSHWSKKNIRMARELLEAGRMHPAGQAAFERRDPDNSGQASFESDRHTELDPAYRRLIRANEAAWTFFSDLPPGYRRTSVHWVMSAKQESTRQRRLQVLIESSAAQQKIPPLR